MLEAFTTAIEGQSATGTVLGFTNTIAPNTLFTATTASTAGGVGNQLVITNKYKGSVGAITAGAQAIGSSAGTYITTDGSGSVATSTTALDTFHNDIGAQTFDGDNLPYSNMPRKANPSDL